MSHSESSKDIKKMWKLFEGVEEGKNIYIDEEAKKAKKKSFTDILTESILKEDE